MTYMYLFEDIIGTILNYLQTEDSASRYTDWISNINCCMIPSGVADFIPKPLE